MSTETKLVTIEDVVKLGDESRCELIRGELIELSPAGASHGRIITEIARQLGNYLSDKSIGECYTADTGFVLERDPDTLLGPDIAFVESGRIPDPEPTSFFEIPPDLAIEVISPSQSITEMNDKTWLWLSGGTAAVWLIDPKRESFTDCRLENQQVVTREVDALEHPLLPGFALVKPGLFKRRTANQE